MNKERLEYLKQELRLALRSKKRWERHELLDIIDKVLTDGSEPTYNTEELQATFKVLGFSQGFVAVEHKETGERGSFDFERRQISGDQNKAEERIYFNYKKA